MSIKDRAYQRVAYGQMLKCVRWCQNTLNLRDWTITLTEIDSDVSVGIKNAELDYGSCEVDSHKMVAEVTIYSALHKKDNSNIYSTIIHEMIHILSVGKCGIDSEKSEPISYAFEDILYEKFCVECKKKIMPVKGV